MIDKLFLGAGFILLFASMSYAKGETEKATFAGGCFWCMEPAFKRLGGVSEVVSGYTGGTGANPRYEDYAEKGHVEAVQITYDPSKISYSQLLDVYWRQVDPLDSKGQFCDRGPAYRPAIFYHSQQQKSAAEKSKSELETSGRFDQPIAVEILPAKEFYKAEDYHQDYYKNNPVRYKSYRFGCGRDKRLDELWGKHSKEELKNKLEPLQYKVTQENDTEPAFRNEYWDNHREGIYVDVVSGEPLFSSLDKFESGTGWPSFTKPLEPDNIVEKEDSALSSKRTEVRSKQADSHLGHVFNDGPPETGLRYCINSAALKFIPKEKLEEEGYGNYKEMFP